MNPEEKPSISVDEDNFIKGLQRCSSPVAEEEVKLELNLVRRKRKSSFSSVELSLAKSPKKNKLNPTSSDELTKFT